MQPCSREMQGMVLLRNGTHDHDHEQQIHHQNAAFDPTSSQDDFLEQMLSSLPSSTWTDTDMKSPWGMLDHNPNPNPNPNPNNNNNNNNKPPTSLEKNVPTESDQFDDSMILASKLRHHQISGGTANSPLMMQQQQQQMMMMAARGGIGGLPLSLANAGDNDLVDASSFKSQGGDASVQALFNGFTGSLHASNQPQNFHHAQSFGAVMNQGQVQASGSSGGGKTPAQPKQRVRARRGQATDPHSIAERLRRERIAERMKALQELVPNGNKTDKASMLDEIIDYVKFLQLQVKVLSMSRLGGAGAGAGAGAPLAKDVSSEGGGGGSDGIQANGRNPNGTRTALTNDSLTVTEHQVAKLMEEDMGSAMQYLQGKGLCLMPISLATALSSATCCPRNPMMGKALQQPNEHGEGPTSPSMSALTVQSATVGNGGNDGCSVKDAASVSMP